MTQGPFSNLDKKTFKQAIIELLEREYKILGSHKVLELIAEDIVALQHKYYPQTKDTSFGHLSWVSTSADNGKPKLGQKREEYKQEVIKLPYITEEDIELKRQNVSSREHDLIRIERLTKAAKEQGALLTVEELAAILNRSTVTISKRIQEYHQEHDDVLPLKGYALDIGRGTTHKKQILELYEQKVAPPDIARQTNHSLEAVDRYIKDYERVKFLVRRNINITQIHHMTGRGKSVIRQYIKIMKTYHPNLIEGYQDG
jgi:predicted transcriptional regulator